MRTKCSSAHSQSHLDLMMRGNLTHSRAPMFAPTPDQALWTSFILDTFQLRFNRQTEVNSSKSSHILFKCQKCLGLPDFTLCSEPHHKHPDRKLRHDSVFLPSINEVTMLTNRKIYCACYNNEIKL